jgi:hypothetical protein
MSFARAEPDLLTPSSPSGRGSSSASLAHRLLRLQRTAGNSAVGRLLARTPSHPMAKQIELADALNEEGLIDAAEQRIMSELSKSDNKVRTTQLGYLRAIQAFKYSPRYRSRKQLPAAVTSQTELDKLTTRSLIEGTIATAGSLWLGYDRAAKGTSPHTAEQLGLLQSDIKFVQDEFASRVKDNAYAFLRDSESRIAAVLESYGLVIAKQSADIAVHKVFFDEDELDDEVDEWLERAQLGHKDRYEAARGKRDSLGKTVERLRALQATVLKLQVRYMDANLKVPLDEADRRRADKRQKGDSEAAKLLFGNTVTPEQRSKEEDIQKAGRELSTAWIRAERDHPVLAAHRDGQQRHLELIDLTGYGQSFAPSGLDFLTDVNIRRAYAASQKRTTGPRTHERAVVKQALRKLVNIHRTRLALRQGLLSFYKLEPVVDFTRRQMFIHPRSVWRVAVDEVVSPQKGVLGEGLEFVHDVFNIALLALAAIPNPLQPVAALYDVARSAYTTMDEYVKLGLQSAYSDTDLDRARSISSADPSLTGFVVSLLATGMSVAQAVTAFKAAAAAKLALHEGTDAARRAAQQTLNDLGKPHGLPNLGDDLAHEAGIAGQGGKPPAGGAPKPPRPPEPPKPPITEEPKPHTTEEPKPRTTPHPSGRPAKPPEPPVKPPPLHPDLTSDEVKRLVTYTTADDVERGVLDAKGALPEDVPTLSKLRSGTQRVNPEMRDLEALIRSMPNTANNRRLLKLFRKFYKTLRDPVKHAEFIAHIWHHAAERQISPLQALEEIVTRGRRPHVVQDHLLRADLLHDAPFIDMTFNGGPHGTHTHMYFEGLIDFHHDTGDGQMLRHLIANAEGAAGGEEYWRRFWNAMMDEFQELEINSPDGLQAILERHLGFPRRLRKS